MHWNVPYVRLRPLQLSSSELSDAQKGRSQKRNSWAPRPQRFAWAAMTWPQCGSSGSGSYPSAAACAGSFDGCERGTAVDSVGSSGEMARRFYVDEELLYVFKTAEMQMRSSFMSRLHQDWSGLLEKVNLQFSRRLSYEMWAMGLEERTCAPKEYYGKLKVMQSSCLFKSLLLDLRCPQGSEQTLEPGIQNGRRGALHVKSISECPNIKGS